MEQSGKFCRCAGLRRYDLYRGRHLFRTFHRCLRQELYFVENRFRRTQRREPAFDVLLPAAADQERKYEKIGDGLCRERIEVRRLRVAS